MQCTPAHSLTYLASVGAAPTADKSRAYAICPPSLVATEVTQLRSNCPDFKLGECTALDPKCGQLTCAGYVYGAGTD